MPSLYIQNMQTPLKAREGDRYLTDWFGKRLVPEDVEAMLDDYYTERGWDVEKGIPTREKLAELGLEFLAEHLK
jgi:aldehyde:ferredoxin oxidoreductase